MKKYIKKLLENYEEIHLSALIGKVSVKVRGSGETPYHREKDSLEKAAQEVQKYLKENGINVRKDVERYVVNGVPKFRTLLVVEAGGKEKKKNLKEGIMKNPGMGLAFVPHRKPEWFTEEIFMKGHRMSPDWDNGKESSTRKKFRYRKYWEVIESLDTFYLKWKDDFRGRKYPVQGTIFNLQGKLWETLMFANSEEIELTNEGRDAIKWTIMVNLVGKMDMPTALSKWKDSYLDLIEDPMESETQEEFGTKLLLWRCKVALKEGKTDLRIGFDLTNSGLLMAGLGFRSSKMLHGSNIGTDSYVDSHSNFAKSLGLNISRDDAKKLHTPLLHGSSLQTLSEKLSDLGVQESTDSIGKRLIQAYGQPVMNIPALASFGADIVSTQYPNIYWRLPDGYKASSKAIMESVPLKVKCMGFDVTVHRNMPLLTDGKGIPVFSARKQGLFANITHSVDAWVLRMVTNTLMDKGIEVGMKHDDYMIHPNYLPILRETLKGAFKKVAEANIYQDILHQLDEYAPYKIPVFSLEKGDLSIGKVMEMIDNSEHFLMP